jgi:hypothetical protein
MQELLISPLKLVKMMTAEGDPALQTASTAQRIGSLTRL